MKNINKPNKSQTINDKDKNGFTLVELLAVIVVLAMLVLIAGRAVTGQITKAKRNTFRTETIEFAKAMINKFEMQEVEDSTETINYQVNANLFITYRYSCSSLESLKQEGDIEFSGDYTGFIEAYRRIGEWTNGGPLVPDTDVNPTVIRVIVSNGKYVYYAKTLTEIAADKNFSKQAVFTSSYASLLTPACPSIAPPINDLLKP